MTTNRVQIGRVIVETPDNPRNPLTATINVWGAWQLRRAEIAAIPGAVKRPHNWGYTLPTDTDPALLEALGAPVLADAAPALAFERVSADSYGRAPIYAQWKTHFFGAAFEIVVHPDVVIVHTSAITLARVGYTVDLEYKRDGSGVWIPQLRYASRSDGDYKKDITDAAKLEAYAKFGALVAAFLDSVPEAFGAAQALADESERAALRREIAELESKLAAARARLETLR